MGLSADAAPGVRLESLKHSAHAVDRVDALLRAGAVDRLPLGRDREPQHTLVRDDDLEARGLADHCAFRRQPRLEKTQQPAHAKLLIRGPCEDHRRRWWLPALRHPDDGGHHRREACLVVGGPASVHRVPLHARCERLEVHAFGRDGVDVRVEPDRLFASAGHSRNHARPAGNGLAQLALDPRLPEARRNVGRNLLLPPAFRRRRIQRIDAGDRDQVGCELRQFLTVHCAVTSPAGLFLRTCIRRRVSAILPAGPPCAPEGPLSIMRTRVPRPRTRIRRCFAKPLTAWGSGSEHRAWEVRQVRPLRGDQERGSGRMSVRSILGGLASSLLVSCLASPAATEEVVEAFRSPFGAARAVSVDPADGSAWAATGSSVTHLAPDGAVLSQSDGFWSPLSVSTDSRSGRCWVADTSNDQVVLLEVGGGELLRLGGFSAPSSVSADPTDGSCWGGRHGERRGGARERGRRRAASPLWVPGTRGGVGGRG